MKPNRSGSKPIVTRAGVLHLLSRDGTRAMSQAEIAANFGVTAAGAGNVIRLLLSTGELILARKGGSNGCTQFYAIPEHKKRREVVQPFRTNAWTPPMSGYDSRLAANASLAMLSRR
jgi:hypothetical protein